VFNHVLYIIKENRTYDQVLGDMPEGNGAKALCIYGDSVTPNQHDLARNFYYSIIIMYPENVLPRGINGQMQLW